MPTSMRLVYLSPVPLASFAQRPHHFVHWFHEKFDAEVLWIEPYAARLPKPSDLRRLGRVAQPSALGPTWIGSDWISRLRFTSIPLEPLALGRVLNSFLWRPALEQVTQFVTQDTLIVAAKPCQLALTLAERYPDNNLMFDVMDHVPAFTSGLSARWFTYIECQLAQKSTWIVSSSTALHEKFASFGPKRHLVKNALTPVPDQLSFPRSVRNDQRLVLGYIGTMAAWFDWERVVQLAIDFPEARIVLVGPCEKPPANLPQNIELRPAIPQDQVYASMQEFTIGLIPFKVNELTEYVDPVKYYEYRALGIPVLSSRFGEMRLRGTRDRVFFLDDDPAISKLLQDRANDVNTSELDSFRTTNHWSHRFDAMYAAIEASSNSCTSQK